MNVEGVFERKHLLNSSMCVGLVWSLFPFPFAIVYQAGEVEIFLIQRADSYLKRDCKNHNMNVSESLHKLHKWKTFKDH